MKKHNWSGFTIVELLLVIAVLAVLAAITMPGMWRGLIDQKDVIRMERFRAGYIEVRAAMEAGKDASFSSLDDLIARGVLRAAAKTFEKRDGSTGLFSIAIVDDDNFAHLPEVMRPQRFHVFAGGKDIDAMINSQSSWESIWAGVNA